MVRLPLFPLDYFLFILSIFFIYRKKSGERSMKKCIVLLLFLLPISGLPASSAPGTDSIPMTRMELGGGLIGNPSLLGFSRDWNFSWSSYYTKDGFTDEHRIALSSYGFGFGIHRGVENGAAFRRYTLGWGAASRITGSGIGLALNWYGSADSSELDGLTLMRLFWTQTVGDSLLFSMGLRDIVLSDHAYGLANQGLAIGLGLRLADGFLALHGGVDFDYHTSIKDISKYAELIIRPFSGMELGVLYSYREGENRFGFSLSLDFGRSSTGSRFWMKNGLVKSRVDFNFRSRAGSGLFGKGRRVLVINLGSDIPEQPVVRNMVLTENRQRTFLDILRSMDRAVRDRSVRVVYLRIGRVGLGYGRAEELIAMIRRMKKAGKKVYAYLESGRALDFTIASTADKLFLQPSVNLHLHGVGATVTYIKGLLDKLGLQADLYYKGKYKAAAQQLMMDRITPEHREAENLLLSRMYTMMLREISRNRGFKQDKKVRQWFKKGVWLPEEAVKGGLVDRTWDESMVLKIFRGARLRTVSLAGYLAENPKRDRWGNDPAIAVVNVTGSIVNGRSGRNPLPVFGGNMAGADTLVPVLNKMAASPGVKALIVRVQSGGGDLIASDKLWRAINRIRHFRRVYISFGDVAASGGYYLSCGDKKHRSRIYAPGTCITGSIGVFTGKVVNRGLKKKIGMNTFLLSAGERAFYWSPDRKFSKAERKLVVKTLDNYYDVFVRKVAAGRGLRVADADRAARGRVVERD